MTLCLRTLTVCYLPDAAAAAAAGTVRPCHTACGSGLPRQALSQTRDDLLEAAVRIVNEYVSHPPRDDDPPVDLLPFVRLDEVLEIASELARRRLKDEGGLTSEERVAPSDTRCLLQSVHK